MMTADEVDWLVYSYLLESGYIHTSFSLAHESAFAAAASSSSSKSNGQTAHPDSVFGQTVPPGHLVRILQKGLLYLEAEARYRGDPVEPAPRLVGYSIPNALPLPPLPKHSTPPVSAPPTPNPSNGIDPPPVKDKGKGKEVVAGKRKGRAGSDESGATGKRARVASGDKKKTSTVEGLVETGEDVAMDVSSVGGSPAPVQEDKGLEVVKTKADKNRSVSPAGLRASTSIVPPVPPAPVAVPAAAFPKPTTIPSVPAFTSPPPHPSSALSSPAFTSPPQPIVPTPRPSDLAKIKAEEAEAQLSKSVEMDMTGVLELAIEDSSVIRLRGHTMPKVQPCSWNPKVPALLATGGGDSTCRMWDVPAVGKREKNKEGPILKDNIVCKHSSAQRRADVAAVAWDPSGSLLATGSEDGIARIWTPSGDLHLVLSMHQRTIFSLKWNSIGTMLLTGSLDNSVCLWELSSGKVKQQWSTHSDSVLDVDWNDDQTFASASMDKSIHLFNISRVSPVFRFKGHRDEVNVVKFSPCGTLLASCSDDSTVRIWSLRNIPGLTLSKGGKEKEGEKERFIDEEDNAGVLVLDGHTRDVHTIAWGPWKKGDQGPRLLASASFDATARLWDADTGTCLYTFSRHVDFVYSLGFSPGLGAYLATGSNDGKMCVWDIKEKKLVLEYTHAGPIYEVAWHPDGQQLVVCGRTEDVACVAFEM